MIEKAADKAYRLARYYESTYKGCSQCVLLALSETVGHISPDVILSATALAAGCARSSNACGAFTGRIDGPQLFLRQTIKCHGRQNRNQKRFPPRQKAP